MTTNFIFPDAVSLKTIERSLLPRLMKDRPIFKFLDIENDDSHLLVWEQRDDYTGMQQLRGLGGAPQRISRLGAKRFMAEPGVFGEFSALDEVEMTKKRAWGQLAGGSYDVTSDVREEQDRLLQRELDLIEYIGWTLLTSGTFAVSTPQGTVAFTDSYTMQTFTATPSWSAATTATPIADLREIRLKSRGYSVAFDSSAILILNSKTANNMYANLNTADLYGRRAMGGGTFNTPGQIGTLLLQESLPQIFEYDGGFKDENGDFHLFVPDDTGILIGARANGDPVGAYRMTRNVNNDGMAPGAYTKVLDKKDQVPRSIEIHRGHNGGPVMYYPSAVVRLTL